MKGFKRCASGHFFKEDLDICPYCPSGASGAGGDKGNTLGVEIPSASGGADLGKTQIFGTSGNAGATQVFGSDGGGDKTQIFGAGAASNDQTNVLGGGSALSAKRDLSKTYIQGVTDTEDGDGAAPAAPRATRKIVGWIISFTLDPMGIDYRIYEGKNAIGRNPENAITITKDTTISGEHAVILYRAGKYYIEDAMTANGTALNGEELEPRKAYNFKDGDRIRFGNTEFLFKSAF